MRNRLIKNELAITASGATLLPAAEGVRVVLGALLAVYLAHELGPEILAVNVVCALVLRYGVFSQLGILAGFSLNGLPVLSEGKQAEFQRYANTAISGLLFAFLLLASLFFAATAFFSFDRIYYLGFIAYTISLLTFQFYNIQEAMARFRDDFRTSAAAMVLSPAWQLCLVVLLVPRIGLEGLFFAVVVAHIPSIALLYLKGHRVTCSTNMRGIFDLIRCGFPIFIATAGVGFTVNLDKILVARSFDNTALGVFSVVVTIATIQTTVCQKLSSVVFQKIRKGYSSNLSAADRMTAKIIPRLYVLLCMISIFTFLLSILGVSWILPEYSSGLAYLPLTLMWACEISIFWLLFSVLSATGRERQLIYSQAFAFIMTLFSYYIVTSVSPSIDLYIVPNIVFGGSLLLYLTYYEKHFWVSGVIACVVNILSFLFIISGGSWVSAWVRSSSLDTILILATSILIITIFYLRLFIKQLAFSLHSLDS